MFRLVAVFATLVAVTVARKAVNSARYEHPSRSHELQRLPRSVAEDVLLDVPGLIEKYGYPVEVHDVETSDGYILELHRIPHGRNNGVTGNVPVLVMHGLLSSSADFVTPGPGKGLAYFLADAGYDVWLGNARGNYYSRRHNRLNPNSNFNKDFWRFSWDQIGQFDLSASIDHILQVSGEEKLHYIGHSQGGTSFLVLNSLRPEYNEKIISFQGLAPASFFENNEVELFKTLASYENVLESTAFLIGLHEIFGNTNQTKEQCAEGSIFSSYCKALFEGIYNREYYNQTILPVIFAHMPAGASIRQVAHYGQVIRFNSFQRYNYNNVRTNIREYGSSTPPTYDLSRVTVPAYLFYGLADTEVNHNDLHKLADNLPNVVKVHRVTRSSFNHFDFLWAVDAKEVLFDFVLEAMKNAEHRFLQTK